MRQLTALLAFALIIAVACAPEDEPAADDAAEPDTDAEPTPAEEPAQDDEAEDSDGLVIDGVEIADAELYEAAQEEGHLTAYFSYPDAVTEPLVQAFAEDTGLSGELVRLPSAQMFERVMSEYGAGVLEADVLSVSELTLMNELIEEGVMEPYEVPEHDRVAEEHRDPDSHWYALILPVMLPAYNSGVVEEADAPSSWEDLLDDRWQDDIGLTHIGTGGSSWSVGLFQRQTFGIEYWEGLAAQDPTILDSVGGLTEQLARGEIAAAVTHLGTSRAAIMDGAPIELVFPDEGVVNFLEAAGVVSTAPNPNAARLFMNWLVTERGASVVAELSGEYAAHPDGDVPTLDGEPLGTPEEINAWVPDPDDYMELRDEWVAEWNEIFDFIP